MSSKQLTVAQKRNRIKDLLQKQAPEIAKGMPASDPEKSRQLAEQFSRIFLTTVFGNPILEDCEPGSLIACAMDASHLGLVVDGYLGHAYIVPFRDNKAPGRPWKAQLIVGYRGMMSLARRSGLVSHIEPRTVHSGDRFSYEYGLRPNIRHLPGEPEQRGPLTYAYAIAFLRGGGTMFEVMSRKEIDKHKARSKSAQSGRSSPWTTDYDAMALKTVIRKLCKFLPQSTEDNSLAALMTAQIAKEEEAEARMAEFSVVDRGAVDEPISTEDMKLVGTPDDAARGPEPEPEPEPEPDPDFFVKDDKPDREPEPEPQPEVEPPIHHKTKEKILRLVEEKAVHLGPFLEDVGLDSLDDATRSQGAAIAEALEDMEDPPNAEPGPSMPKPPAELVTDKPVSDSQIKKVRDLVNGGKLDPEKAKLAVKATFGKEKVLELTRAECEQLIEWAESGSIDEQLQSADGGFIG